MFSDIWACGVVVGNTALVADRVGSNPSVGKRVIFSGKTNAFSGKVNAFSYLLKKLEYDN